MAKHSNTIRFLIVSVSALLLVTAFNLTADIGAALHDVVCPEHGWFA